MLETMTIRCDQCGHENNPLYRFCGMCGSPLAPPVESKSMPSFNPAPRPLPRNDPPRPARPAPPPQEAWPVSGPSFLGLGDEPAAPSRNVDYLLEDDDRPRRTFGRAFLVLLILAGFGALLYYHWKGEGVSVTLAQLWSKVNPQSAAPAPPAAQPTPPPNATAPEPSPTDTTGSHAATVTEDSTQQAANAPPTQPNTEPTPSPAPAAATPKAEAAQPESSADDQEQAEAAPSNAAPAKPAPHPARKTAPATAASAATAPEPTFQDSLAVEGERYLYGNGVPENCDRAQRSLTRAAQGGSAKAYTLLGAMYATGHCATRDLPTSYRWFARALRQDPGNTRLEKNLEVVWRQMTPEERTIATRQ